MQPTTAKSFTGPTVGGQNEFSFSVSGLSSLSKLETSLDFAKTTAKKCCSLQRQKLHVLYSVSASNNKAREETRTAEANYRGVKIK